ncbi:TetR/AcrR family transcriptional regulator [Enterococcus sp. LJL51]|uniref:TetR/AcrR family transcriptional regulator n=1 Tax=Enterococcus sp. LJL51 TaxID=3416656 RepID=UPI003CF6FB4E
MKRAEKKAMTRKKILAAATVLYGKKGFVEVSIEEISRQAEVGKGTVFLHFVNQDRLMEEVISQLLKDFDYQMQTGMIASLEDYLFLHLSVLEQYEDLYVYFITQRLLLNQEVSYLYVSIQAAFAHHFERAVNDTLSLPLAVLFTNWLGFIHYYLENRDLFGGKNIIKRNKAYWIEQFLTLVYKGGIKK